MLAVPLEFCGAAAKVACPYLFHDDGDVGVGSRNFERQPNQRLELRQDAIPSSLVTSEERNRFDLAELVH